jgi:exodeoxyribonuclease VII large subunit
MFRHKAQLMGWLPQDGAQVEVRALATIYETRGKFQLNVEVMRRAGLGALYEAFEKRKAKLDKEGLFADEHKQPIPAFPCGVGIVTSPQAAALCDVLTTLRRRMPSLPVVLYPTPVQGEGAAAKIAQAITEASARAEQDQCDVLIVCRGGGSIEDLWSYNEEVVARAIHACRIPVVSGVGHETDFTIADFVADARAPTPTAAAELVSPDRAELRTQVRQHARAFVRVTQRLLEDRMQKLDFLARRLVHPGERIRERTRHLVHLASRLAGAWQRDEQNKTWTLRSTVQRLRGARPDWAAYQHGVQDMTRRLRDGLRRRLELAESRLARTDARLNALNPQLVLERGYSIAETADGVIVRDAAVLKRGDELRLTFARGAAMAEIKK